MKIIPKMMVVFVKVTFVLICALGIGVTVIGQDVLGARPLSLDLERLPSPAPNGLLLAPVAILPSTSADLEVRQVELAADTAEFATHHATVTAGQILAWLGPAGDGDVALQLKLGLADETGTTGRRDYSQAIYWYQRLMVVGLPDHPTEYYLAEARLGGMKLLGYGTVRDIPTGAAMIRDAAAHDDESGQGFMALMSLYGWDGPQDFAAARQWAEKARANIIIAHYSPAYTILGTLYLEGWGVPQDLDRAAEMFGRGGFLGDNNAIVKMGEMYLWGIGMPMDVNKAMANFRNAANTDTPLAYFGIAEAYHRHCCDPAHFDFPSAARYYKLAADAGLPLAEGEVALMNFQAMGIQRDPKLAVEYARRATSHGDVFIQKDLARILALNGVMPPLAVSH